MAGNAAANAGTCANRKVMRRVSQRTAVSPTTVAAGLSNEPLHGRPTLQQQRLLV
jgi:hypothetical protein|tara:strand:+ start:581 stop:745 length:165 start_codon:yes stop_codon:yes gene_type:complete